MKNANADNRYGAFLRGVNVKGTNMKMTEVCAVFESAGMTEVTSVLASGNILFTSGTHVEEIKKVLEEAMSAHFAYEAFIFVKSQQEIEAIVQGNPFEKNPEYHIYSFVGVDDIEKILQSEFEKSRKVSGEEAQLVGPVFYWKVPKGNTLDSEFGNILGRKSMKNTFTSRNINTFEKVLKKL